MKGAALFIAIFALALLVIPMVALSFQTESPSQPAALHTPNVPASSENETMSATDSQDDVQTASQVESEPQYILVDEDEEAYYEEDTPEEVDASRHGVSSFRVLDQSSGQVVTVSLRDYVRGAVAAEMPVSFHPEALKAQAVAAHTYALHNHIAQLQNPDPALMGADFVADPSNMLVYITEETAKEFYGDNADAYWDKICQAADEVMEYILEYDDEPIVAAYHAISAGQTEDAENVWSGTAPYLLAADSAGDLLAPDYETTVTLSREEVSGVLLSHYPAMDLSGDPDSWFDGVERSSSGYITSIDVGGEALHGKEIRELFDLRSHNFDIEYLNSGSFSFTVYGYGHGVGLSQYGADFLARQGYSFEEILENYYSDAVLKRIEVDILD